MAEDIFAHEYRNSNKTFPNFTKPSIVGYFSVDEDRNVIHNMSQLKFLHMPPCTERIMFDLNKGINTSIPKDENTFYEKIDHLLKFIIHNNKVICSRSTEYNLLNVDIVCFRGLLTVLMCSPFENKEGWYILAYNWRGTTYLCAWQTEDQIRQRLQDMKHYGKFMSWGYKFEQFLLSSEPDQIPDVTKPVIEAEEFCCVFKSKLGNLNLLYGAEMDGIDVTNTTCNFNNLEKNRFIELKTSRIISSEHQLRNFKKFKLIKWWCQSFLVGIEDILCGCRDDKGILHEIKHYRVKDIPKNNDNFWNATDCMNFCKDALNFMHNVAQQYQNQTVLFSWNPGSKINYTVDNSKFFLNSWYCQTLKTECGVK